MILLVLAVAPAPARSAGQYTIVDLGTVPGANSFARDINKFGQIVGYSQSRVPDARPARAFAISPENGVWFEDLDGDGVNDLAVDLAGSGPTSRAFALNDSGEVVGHFSPDPNVPWRPTIWQGATLTVIAPVGAGSDGTPFDSGTAFDINGFGVVVGTSGFLPLSHLLLTGVPFVWDGTSSQLALPPGFIGQAKGINDRGQIVGDLGVFANDGAIVWEAGTAVELPTIPGSNFSRANAINELSQAVGFSQAVFGGTIDPTLWLPTPAYGLPAGANNLGRIFPQPAMEARDINDSGQIVGDRGFNIAFLWLPEPAYGLPAGHHTLDFLIPTDSGWTRLFEAHAINAWGQIVGSGERDVIGGEIHAYLMTPIGVVPPPPPQGFETASNFEYSGEDSDPINTFSGELLLRDRIDVDLGGPMPLRFMRYYASALGRAGIAGQMGENWRHGFEWTLSIVGSNAELTTARGRTIRFRRNGATWELKGARDIPFQLVESGAEFVFGDPRHKHLLTFDTSGKLLEISDGKGNAQTLTYAGGTLTHVADGLGRTLSFTYDPDGNLTTVSDGIRTITYTYTGSLLTNVTDLRGKVTNYVYDGAHALPGLLVAETRPRTNRPFTQTYDASGRVATQTDALANTTSLVYDPPETRITDPDLKVRSYIHDPAGSLLSVTNQNGEPIAMDTDTSNRRNRVTDREGNTTEMTFDSASGRLASVRLPDTATTILTYTPRTTSGVTFYDLTGITHRDTTAESFVYDAAGNMTSRLDRASETWSATYNGHGQILTGTNPAAGVTSLAYNSDGTLASVQDPATNTTTFGFDALRRLVLLTHPDTNTRSFAYDDGDLIISITDENSRTTTFAYDDNGNLTSITDPLVKTRTFSYDDLDRIDTVSDPGGRSWELDYDAHGRISAVTDPAGNATGYAYDDSGRLNSVTDPGTNMWLRARDAEGRITAWTNPLGRTVQFVRDSLGRVTDLISPLGNTSHFTYDGLGRIATAGDPLMNVTTFTYDPRGGLASTTLPGGISASYGYGALGLVNRITDPGGRDWLYGRDALGRIGSCTDPLGNGTTFTYDSQNRLAVATFPAGLGSVTRSYDGVGNRTRELYSDGNDIVLGYDAVNRLTSALGIALAYDDNGEIVSSNGIGVGRDPAGRVGTLTLAPGKVVTYSYNQRDLVTSVTDWVGGSTAFAYDAVGRLMSIARPNGTTTTFTYDDDNRITNIAEGAIANTALTRDAAGRVVSAIRSVPLPPSSAITPFAAAYDAASQAASFTYDALGRVTNDGTRTYVWDLVSRLRSYAEGVAIIDFTYDALGRLLTRTEGATTQAFVWNDALPERAVSIVREEGSDVRYYIHTPDGLLLHSVEAAGDARRFHHYDERGNAILLTDDAGSLTDSYSYSPYGELTGSTGSSVNPFMYAGRHGVIHEPGTSLYWMGRRVYDSAARRFLSREPVPQSDPLAINPYQYAASDPLRFIDPTGSNPRQPGFEGGAADKTLGTVGTGTRWTTYVTSKAAASMATDVDAMAGRIAKYTLRGPGGVPRPDKLAQVARLQRLGSDTRAVGKAAKRIGAAGSVIGNAVDAWKFKERVEKITAETLSLQDANLKSLTLQMDEVVKLLKQKKISVERAAVLVRQIQSNFEESQRGTAQANRFGIFTEAAQLVRNTAVSFLPAPAQVAEGVAEKALGDVFVVDR